MTQLSEPGLADQLDDAAIRGIIQDWPILTFDPLEELCPLPFEVDLVWAWPLILLSGAWILLLMWLYHRKNR